MGKDRKASQESLRSLKIKEKIAQRYSLTMEEYDQMLDLNMEWLFGVKEKVVDISPFSKVYDSQFAGKGLLVLNAVKNYHRKYVWS